MEIPQEIIDSRVLIVKPDTDLELILSVEHYNGRMVQARKQMRGLIRLERILLFLNVTLLVTIGVIGIRTGGVFIFEPRIEWLETASLAVFVAAFLWFGLIKRNFIVLTLFSALLIFMDLRGGIITLVNIVITALHELKLRNVKDIQGFPFFRSIHIERKNDAPAKNLELPIDKSE